MRQAIILMTLGIPIILGSLFLFIAINGAAASIWGGPECFNDYSYPRGYEGGCYGGMIRYRGAVVFPLFSGLIMFFLLPSIMPLPSFGDWYRCSRFRKRQLFDWLEGSD